MIDLHNHMLPGLDDGAPNWEEALTMARMAAEDGIQAVMCTPHRVPGRFENTRPIVLQAVEELRNRLAKEKIPLTIYPGSELRLDYDLPESIHSGELLTLNDTGRYALIELSDEIMPQNLDKFLWDFQTQGVTPVIAHPERNPILLRDPSRLYKWVEMGVLAQLTSASLQGRFGTAVLKFSIFLLEHHMVHVLSTDAHGSLTRLPILSEGYRQARKIVGKEMADQIVHEIPRCIVQGDPVTPFDPIPLGSRSQGSSLWKRLFPIFGSRSR